MRHPARPLVVVLCSVLGVAAGCVRPPDAPQAPAQPVDGQPTAPVTVAAHTSGTVSSESRIRVAFSASVVEATGPVDPRPLTFEPPLEGTAGFSRTDELEFKPAAPLPRGQRYTGRIDRAALGLAGGETFSFEFAALEQGFGLNLDGIDIGTGGDRSAATLRGHIATTDVSEAKAIEKGLQVSAGKRSPSVSWEHDDNRKDHRFIIRGLSREDDDYNVSVTFDGKALGATETEEINERIPGLNTFSVLMAKAVQDSTRHLEVRFSDPIDTKQDLRGLITVKGQEDSRVVVKGNVVEIFGNNTFPGAVDLVVSPGIKNTAGYRLKKGGEYAIRFERLKPSVRFVGKGVVVPSTDGLTVPIETANLGRLTIEAMRVSDANLPQFFQVNRYDGDSELKRVGRVVWKRTVNLGDKDDLRGAWTRHGLELTKLVRQERSGMLRLRLRFERSDTLYSCSAKDKDGAALPPEGALTDDDELGNWDDSAEASAWDSYEGNYWELYEKREDPCHAGYYRKYDDHDITVTRNIILSDLGLIAKKGASGDVLAVVTDLKTAKPRSGARVQILDYQQQVIAQGRTDTQGQLRLKLSRTPFLLVADHRGDKGFLRLDDGGALSVAHFDTSGATVKKGLKGFFFGERGVWRPGDKIFLTFVLSDRDRPLPGAHPLHFTLKDPQGKVIKREVRKESNDGFYVFKLKTAHDAPTGNYTADVRVGGTSFSHVLKVEAIRPNRLKIGLESELEVLKPKTSIDADLSAQWLHGASAEGLRAEVDVTLVPSRTSFSKFSEYRFDAVTRRHQSSTDRLFEGTLGEGGKTTLNEKIAFNGAAAGMLKAAFTTRVFEKSGAFSVDRHTLPFSPYDRYVGVRLPPGDKARGMLLTDEKHKVRVVVVDEKGEKVKEKTSLKVRLYKMTWRWWWEKGAEDLTDYAGTKSHQPLEEATIAAAEGEASWEFEIKYPSWGRYLVVVSDLNGGHATGSVFYADWPGWAGRAQKDQPGGATVLSLATDKKSYRVGEEVALTIPSSVAGRALVSLENGSRVVRADWVETAGKTVQYKFTVTADMAPNVFAHVTLLQPHLATGNDLPIRLYGITPIQVVDPTTRLKPTLKAPESFTPGKVAKVSVSEANGLPMTYTLAIVDEGLLGLTRYKTPDPWNFFFAREALGVKTWDLFDEVAGAYGGQLENLLAIGGDGSGDDGGRQRANRFPPMVVFKGPFSLDAGEEKNHAVQLPPYVGAVRVMVVAGHEHAYGKAEQSVYVRKPLIVLPTLPRVVGPGEDVALPVAVFALDEKVKDVKVRVSTNGLAKVVGAKEKSLKFKALGDQIVPFKLKISDQLGVAKIKIEATGGGESATYEVEVEVRHPGAPVTNVTAKTLEAGGSWQLAKLPLHGLSGTNTVMLELSRVPPMDLERRLGFLIRYPHGCVEQTTSAAFPQVHLTKLLDLTPERVAAVETNVKKAIDKLQGFQNSSGGFSYWPTDRRPHDWSTSWVGHFLLEAKAAGYRVPSEMLTRWIGYQQDAARRFRPGAPDHAQAYRLYTLALAGAAEIGAMNRLKEASALSDAARWRLAAAYHLARQSAAAKALVTEATTAAATPTALSGTFASTLRDQAMILETLVLLKDPRAMALGKTISEALSEGRGHNTQATAFGLIAMSRWASSVPRSGENLAFSVTYGDRPAVTVDSAKPLVQVPLVLSAAEQAKPGPLKVESRGEGGFARLIVTGTPPIGEEEASDQGLSIDVDYAEVGGGPLDVERVEQGTDLTIKVSLKNTSPGRKLYELALTHVVPSGFELRNTRLDPGLIRAAVFDYQDIRDDRVLTYFDLGAGATTSFEVVAHAAFPGHYYLPPILAEAMYDASVHARTKGRWIEIVEASPPDTD